MREESAQWHVGRAVITSVVEHAVVGVPAQTFFPDATPELITAHPWLMPEYATREGAIALAVRAFIIELGGRRLLVDPCVGNGKQRAFPLWNDAAFPFLERLLSAGFSPASIDTVVHTHLHPDHVGWDTHRVHDVWTPTFPHASHLYTKAELDFWRDPARRRVEDVWLDSVEPVLAAGLARVVAEDEDLGHGLRLASTPGHTPGHVSLWIESEGERAVISGDVLTHPLQCARPDLAHAADWDPEQCRTSRRRFLETVRTRGALLLVNHFPGRCGGHLSSDATDGYRFEPAADRREPR